MPLCPSILLIHQDEQERRTIEALLSPHYTVTAVPDAAAATSHLQQSRQLLLIYRHTLDHEWRQFLEMAMDRNPALLAILVGSTGGQDCPALHSVLDVSTDIARLRNAIDMAASLCQRMTVMERQKSAAVRKADQLQQQNHSLSMMLDQFDEIQDRLFEMERFYTIGKMAAFLVHDLRQPIDLIRSSVDALIHLDLTSEEKSDISDIVLFETRRFQDMITEILEYARGDVPLNMKPVEISDLFDTINEEMERFLASHLIDYYGQFIETSGTLMVDLTRFSRMTMNLVKNAAEALRKKTGIEAARIDFRMSVDQEWVLFCISDNGPGIPEDLIDRIFDPFVSGRSNGIGLGLAIVKKTIAQHQGEIWCTSRPDGGTEFHFRLRKNNGNGDH